jgi:hypothetical protein
VTPSSRPDPPYVPIRSNGWKVRRTPKWVLVGGLALVVGAVLVALVHKPSKAERASDLQGVLQEVTTDIQSCAGGLGESLQALREVKAEDGRSSSDVGDAISIAEQGAANCSPANNEQLDDLENYEVPESLDSFNLAGAVTGLVDWASPDAERVQTDVALLLSARSSQAKSRAEASLSQALASLDAQRHNIDGTLDAAIKSLGLHATPPRLPG